MNTFAVVLLNWNGTEDTLDCLQSLRRSDPDAVPIVVDNGSQIESREQLQAGLAEQGWTVRRCEADDVFQTTGGERNHAWLMLSDENLGFSRGCNLGLRLAAAIGLPEVVFLNNDTLVEPGALGRLVTCLRQTESLFAVIPQIRIFGTDLIWNCGGRLSRLGFRRYHYGACSYPKTHLPKVLNCTFFTGCCFVVRTKEFLARNGFCERFFFGEEDFELCWWMLKHRRRAVCLTESVVQHKVSASVGRAAAGRPAKVYLYYLNRLTHMRLQLGRVFWGVWLCGYLPYVIMLFVRMRIVPFRELRRFFVALVSEAATASGVDRPRFEAIMRTQPW